MPKPYSCSIPNCQLPTTPQPNSIIVHGAAAHNLKNVCFTIPKKKLVALTGLSGSGKSSIAFDVLGQECVRQYLESLGMTTDHVPKAKVGTILGLSPSICISQRVSDFNPRSMVGTKTGILTILRNMFASMGQQHCSHCGHKVKQPLQDQHKLITTIDEKEKERSYFDCPHCNAKLEKLKMEHFSFNSLSGACEDCKGSGEIIAVDFSTLLDEKKSIRDGAIKIWEPPMAMYKEKIMLAASQHYKFAFDPTLPIEAYTKMQKDFLLYGIAYPDFVAAHKNIKAPSKVSDGKYEGVVPYLMELYKNDPAKAESYVTHQPCITCNNTGLGKLARTVTIADTTILQVSKLSLDELLSWIKTLKQHISEDQLPVFTAFANALEERTSNLIEVGLDYLTLDRPLPSLSAGEAQRLRLAAVLGSGLTDVLYVLDEPTTGLHPHDTAKLLKTLQLLKDAGNTVLVIEHDLDVIKNADYIIDIGPGRGSQGGEIVASGIPAEIMANPKSITGQYLAKPSASRVNTTQRSNGKEIIIRNASEHHLKNVDVVIPLNQFVVLTGVSGSGKSTLLFDILDKAARKYLNSATALSGKYASIDGLQHINRIITIDQTTIGKTKSSRSNVATYTKLFDLIRDLFAELPTAKARGFNANSFSFNTSNERCTNCNGAGTVEVDLSFMPGIEMQCPSCHGMRFNENLLAVKFHGVNIAEVLEMTISEAIPLFATQKKIFELLTLMMRVGTEHLKLGQSTSTLSGGEAQRIKLATELTKSGTENTLYLLDEPTTGLHAHEIQALLTILKELVSKENSVVVIEHNLEVIKDADTIIDFGPRGGIAGGSIVATGTVSEIAANKNSLTGQALQTYI